MKQYLDLLQDILNNGVKKDDRTGTGTLSVFGRQMRFDLSKGFPLVTTKKVHLKSIIHELLWFLSGDTNIGYLKDNGVKIWDEWANDKGDLGPVYGAQWRNWNGMGVDQIDELIKNIRLNPNSRRHVITAWNPEALPSESLTPQDNVDIGYQALPPCHMIFQFYVANGKLSCHLNQRSGDTAIGIPFNIASYSLLTMMIAQVCDLELGEFIHTIGDAHIYLNHIEQCKEQLKRKPLPLPIMTINPSVNNIDDFKYSDFKLEMYNHHPTIKMAISV